MIYGGIEAGGTKWVCAVGDGGGQSASVTFPTTPPAETMARAAVLHRARAARRAGVGSFGPVDLRRARPPGARSRRRPSRAGRTRSDRALRSALACRSASTPTSTRPRWASAAGARPRARRLLVPHRRHRDRRRRDDQRPAPARAAAPGVRPHAHPARPPGDPFDGRLPVHGDCLEGLAVGRARSGAAGASPGQELDDPGAWELEAEYLALGLVNVISMLSPQRIIVGGGVARRRSCSRGAGAGGRAAGRLPAGAGADRPGRGRALHRGAPPGRPGRRGRRPGAGAGRGAGHRCLIPRGRQRGAE